MKTNQDFFNAFSASQTAVSRVASMLANANYDVLIKPTVVRPSAAERMAYGDSGDIELRQRVEVKWRDLIFTNERDYPYSTVFVDEEYKIDRTTATKVYGYFILDKTMTHYCFIPIRTKSQWTIVRRWSPIDKREATFYECGKTLCVFGKL